MFFFQTWRQHFILPPPTLTSWLLSFSECCRRLEGTTSTKLHIPFKPPPWMVVPLNFFQSALSFFLGYGVFSIVVSPWMPVLCLCASFSLVFVLANHEPYFNRMVIRIPRTLHLDFFHQYRGILCVSELREYLLSVLILPRAPLSNEIFF